MFKAVENEIWREWIACEVSSFGIVSLDFAVANDKSF